MCLATTVVQVKAAGNACASLPALNRSIPAACSFEKSAANIHQTRKRAHKSIRFAEAASVVFVPTNAEHSRDERENTWRTKKDRMYSEDEAAATIDLYNKNNGCIPPRYGGHRCIRGLEPHTCPEYTRWRRQLREDHVSAVLHEQNMQRRRRSSTGSSITNDVALRDVAELYSTVSLQMAISRGQQDAACV